MNRPHRQRPPGPPGRRAVRRPAAVGVAAALVAGLLATAPPAAAAGKPDLRVQQVTTGASSVAEGAEIAVSHVVLNKGRRSAGATATRFYLASDVTASLAERRATRTHPRSSTVDVLLTGAAAVAPVKARGRTSVGGTTVTVPVGTRPGTYTLLACADDHGAVREAQEADNCAAGPEVTVTAAPGSDTLTLRQFADVYRWPATEEDGLAWLEIFCDSTYPARRLSLGGAVDSARAHLASLAGDAALGLVAGSPLADTPEEAQELAAAAVLSGSPGLALASLLRAHELEPRSGSHLVNAAAVAVSLGLPNEAIAFLDASVGRHFLRPALAVSQQATANVIRGQALVMTGRPAEARRLLVAARLAVPMLSETDAGLAAIEACEGRGAVAMRYARRSRVRSDDPVPPTPPTESETPSAPVPALETTLGAPMPLRRLPIPETPRQGVVMNEVYVGLQDSLLDEIDERNAEQSTIEEQLYASDHTRTAAEIQRRDGILRLVYQAHQAADVRAAHTAFREQVLTIVERREAFWGGGTGESPYTYDQLSDAATEKCRDPLEPPNCYLIEMNRTCRPALDTAHAHFRTELGRLQNLGEAYLDVWSRRMSGIAANLGHPGAHRIAMLTIEGAEAGIYSTLVHQAEHWTQLEKLVEEECVAPLPADVLNPPPAGEADGASCEDGLNRVSVRASLGPTTLKVSCERIQQSVSAELLPLLSAYAEVVYDFRTGKVTVFAGVKGGGKVGNVVDAGFKSGIYLTAGPQGDITDVGWRVGPSVNVVAGTLEVSAFKDEIDISFLPEVEATP